MFATTVRTRRITGTFLVILVLLFWFRLPNSFKSAGSPPRAGPPRAAFTLERARLNTPLAKYLKSSVSIISPQEDYIWRQACHYRNVCVAQDKLTLYAPTAETAARAAELIRECCSTGDSQFTPRYGGAPKPECADFSDHICFCFTGQMAPSFESWPTPPPPFEASESFLLNQWRPPGAVNFHNPAHFALKAFSYLDVAFHGAFYGVPDIDTLIWQDAVAPFSDFEWTITNLTDKALGHSMSKIITRNDLVKPMCFASMHSSIKGNQFWGVNQDIYDHLRVAISEQMGLQLGLSDTSACPPFRAGIFRRAEGNGLRRLLNDEAVADVLKSAGFRNVEFFSTHAGQSALEQATIFNRYGLVVSSHGSQLMNSIYMHRNAAILEIQPIVIDQVWSNLARLISIHHVHSPGHEPTPSTEQTRKWMAACEPYIKAHLPCGRPGAGSLQAADLTVDLEQLREEVLGIWRHLQVTCSGTFSPFQNY